MAEGTSEKPVVIENETGEVIQDPGLRSPESQGEKIGNAATKMAGAMTEKQQIAVLQTAHQVGLDERRKAAIEAGKAQRRVVSSQKPPWWKFWEKQE